MKPCPFCAEEIQDQAVKCKHCGSTIPALKEASVLEETPTTVHATHTTPLPSSSLPSRSDGGLIAQLRTFPRWVKIILFVMALGVSASITLACLATWYVVKKTKWSTRNKIISIILAWIVAIGLMSFGFYLRRAPRLTITSPASEMTIATAMVDIQGSVDPKNSEVSINGMKIVLTDGRFSQSVILKDKNNIVTIVADNSGNRTTSTLTLLRQFTADDEAEFTIDFPKNGQTVTGSEIEIKGTVSNDNVRIAINNSDVDIHDKTFSQKFPIVFDDNKFTIEATNIQSVRAKEMQLIVKREMTAEERRAQAEADRAAKAKAAAEKAACDKDKACRICSKHKDWDKLDCERIAKNEYWIGMDIYMLIEERGKPNRVNPSNYGRGTMYQYCWDDYTPMCFYDNNGDNKVDSYN